MTKRTTFFLKRITLKLFSLKIILKSFKKKYLIFIFLLFNMNIDFNNNSERLIIYDYNDYDSDDTLYYDDYELPDDTLLVQISPSVDSSIDGWMSISDEEREDIWDTMLERINNEILNENNYFTDNGDLYEWNTELQDYILQTDYTNYIFNIETNEWEFIGS